MHTAAHEAAQPSRAELRRIVVAIVIGNGFVTYDFTVYSFSAVIIGNLFFPSSNPASSLLLSLATFGAGFVMRPLGAIMIGHIADSRGRKAGLTVSLTLMTLGTWPIEA
jgi:MHS family proline/betaine transporter-like MFS transporter